MDQMQHLDNPEHHIAIQRSTACRLQEARERIGTKYCIFIADNAISPPNEVTLPTSSKMLGNGHGRTTN
jgi:hypothetical protein